MALKADGAWALARDKFAALKQTTSSAPRELEFEYLNAATRADEPSKNNWRAGQAWRNEYLPRVEKMLADYPVGATRDEVWAGLTELRARINELTNHIDWSDWLALADYRAAASPSPEATQRYLDLLRRLSSDRTNYLGGTDLSGLTTHFATAQRIAKVNEDRAWAAREYATYSARMSALSVGEKVARWRNAASLARGTSLESIVAADEFLFRAGAGFSSDTAADSPADIPALLNELETHRTALQAAPVHPRAADMRKRLDNLQHWWTDGKVIIDAPAQTLPGAEIVYRYAATGCATVGVEVWRHSLASWFRRPGDERELARAGISGQMRESAAKVRETAEFVRRIGIDFGNLPTHRWHSEVRKLEPLPPGFYSLVAAGTGPTGEKFSVTHLVVTDVEGIVAFDTTGKGRLFVTRIDSRAPASGKSLKGIYQQDRSLEKWSGATDDEGTIDLPALKPTDGIDRIAALIGDQPIEFQFHTENRGALPLVVDFVVDRAVYRPGETVNWRLVARDRRAGEFAIPQQTKLALTLRGNYSDEPLLDQSQVQLGRFGTAHGSFVIPKSARSGGVNLEVSVNAGDKTNRAAEAYHVFLVDNFVPPAVVAKIDFPGPWQQLRPGNEITARVRVSYYSGGPVIGAPVVGSFSSTGGNPPTSNDEGHFLFTSWRDKLKDRRFAVITNAEGEATVSLSLPQQIVGNLTLQFSADVTPDGGQAVKATGSVTIMPAGRRLDSSGWYGMRAARPGEVVEFSCRVLDGRGQPATYSGIAQLMERTWEEAWLTPNGKIVGEPEAAAARTVGRFGAERPPTWRQLHAGYANRVVASQSATAADDGTVRVKFTLPSAGIFQLMLLDGEAKLGEPNLSEALCVLAADEQTGTLALRPGTIRVLAPVSINAGDQLSCLIVGNAAPLDGVLTVAGEETSVSQPFQFTGRLGWINVTKLPKFARSGQVSVAAWGAGKIPQSHQASFEVVDSPGNLLVQIKPAEEETKPGTKTSALIRVTDQGGKPVSAELSLAVSDEAVNRLVREQPPTSTSFEHYFAQVQTRFSGSRNYLDEFQPLIIRDPRPGALLNPTIGRGARDYDEAVSLEAFNVASPRFFGAMAARQAFAPAGMTDEKRITLRSVFVSSAAWFPEIETDANGEARVPFTLPDNLTRWELDAYAVGAAGGAFGRNFSHVRASLPFQARLQAPQFLISGDHAEVSGLFVNRTSKDISAEATLKIDGQAKRTFDTKLDSARVTVTAQGEARASWPIMADTPGKASLTLSARSAITADAMTLTVPVLSDGFIQETAASATLTTSSISGSFDLPLPQPLDPTRTTVALAFNLGSVDAVLDALPYVIDFPYGCVEQTMSRFLPAVIARKSLLDLGVSAEAIERRIASRESRADARRRAKTAGLARLDEVVEQSLARLADARIEDHPVGYGWWPRQERADPWMTAYVAWGLALAHDAGCKIPEQLFPTDAIATDASELTADDGRLAWTLVAGSAIVPFTNQSYRARTLAELKEAFSRAFAARDRLSPTGRACLGLAAAKLGTVDERRLLLRNLENGAQRGAAGSAVPTVHWGSTSDYWRAMDGAVESTALTVLALLELDSKSELIEPAVRWLILNRSSDHWTNTRDTAFALLALTRHLQARGVAKSTAEVTAMVNGKKVGRVALSLDKAIAGQTTLDVPAQILRGGANRFELTRTRGDADFFAVATASSWSDYETTRPAGHLVALTRGFVRQKSQPTVAGAVRFVSEPLAENAAAAGEQVNVVVSLDVSNAMEYVMIAVPKPAGCEPLNPLSGWDARLRPEVKSDQSREDNGRALYREEHDDRSVFFVDQLDAGRWELQFGMRAITPGNFRSAPATVEAMYVPAIRANSDAMRVKIDTRASATSANTQ